MRALALVVLLGTAAAAQDVRPLEILKSGDVETLKGDVVVVEPGSAYLPPETLLATGKELADLRVQNVSLKDSLPIAPAWAWAAGGAVVGGTVVWLILTLLPKPVK